MNRPKKEGTFVSAFIKKDAYSLLVQHCEETGQSKTKALERAIEKYCGNTDKSDKTDKNVENKVDKTDNDKVDSNKSKNKGNKNDKNDENDKVDKNDK